MFVIYLIFISLMLFEDYVVMLCLILVMESDGIFVEWIVEFFCELNDEDDFVNGIGYDVF